MHHSCLCSGRVFFCTVNLFQISTFLASAMTSTTTMLQFIRRRVTVIMQQLYNAVTYTSVQSERRQSTASLCASVWLADNGTPQSPFPARPPVIVIAFRNHCEGRARLCLSFSPFSSSAFPPLVFQTFLFFSSSNPATRSSGWLL